MPESTLVNKKDETIPSHHDNPLRYFRCASFALKLMDEKNDLYLGQPSQLTNYMRVHMIPLWVFTLQLANKTIFHGGFFSATWETNFTTSERKIFRFPRYRHICLKCACNAIPALQTQSRYRHTFSVSQECACNKYLLYLLLSCHCYFMRWTIVRGFVFRAYDTLSVRSNRSHQLFVRCGKTWGH